MGREFDRFILRNFKVRTLGLWAFKWLVQMKLSANSHVCLIPMQALCTTSSCLLVLIIFHFGELLYSLLSTSTSFILFKPPHNAYTNIIYFIDIEIESEKATITSNINNNDHKINNDNYLLLLMNWLAQGSRAQTGPVWASDSSLLMLHPEFVPPSKDGSLQHDHSMISLAGAEERGLQHQPGIQLVWLLKWLNICH